MSFIESMELCSYGAKVIYPPTIYPVFHKNIPIKILNTFNASAPGTLITDSPLPDDLPIKGISILKETTLFLLGGNLTRGVKNSVSRTFNALAKKGVKVFNVTRSDGNPDCRLPWRAAMPTQRLTSSAENLRLNFPTA